MFVLSSFEVGDEKEKDEEHAADFKALLQHLRDADQLEDRKVDSNERRREPIEAYPFRQDRISRPRQLMMHMPAHLKVAVEARRSSEQQRLGLLFCVHAVFEQKLLVYARHLKAAPKSKLAASV